MPDKGGFSLRDRLTAQLERKRKPEDRAELEALLECPAMPLSLRYVWDAYHRLRSRKGTDAMGNAQPIEWGDLDAFNRLSGLRLVPWEIEVIERLDDAYRVARAVALAD